MQHERTSAQLRAPLCWCVETGGLSRRAAWSSKKTNGKEVLVMYDMQKTAHDKSALSNVDHHHSVYHDYNLSHGERSKTNIQFNCCVFHIIRTKCHSPVEKWPSSGSLCERMLHTSPCWATEYKASSAHDVYPASQPRCAEILCSHLGEFKNVLKII